MRDYGQPTIIFLATLLLVACASHQSTLERPARATKENADALIQVCADKLGRPYDITITRSSGVKDIDREILRAAKSWKFPAQRADGTPRPECEEIPIGLKASG